MIRERIRYKRDLKFETLEPRVVLSHVPLITEFMAVNDTALADGDGNFSDWIEIHNPTVSTIDLDGWHLTDNATNLDKWTFPELSQSMIASGGYLVVFATNQPTETYIDGGGNLHTDFKLSGSGEYLALVDPSLTLAHEFTPTFPEQVADVSYGPQESGGVYNLSQLKYFSAPTPGADNGTGAGTVTYSAASHTFSASFNLVLTTANPSADIRYTTNGAIPNASSTLYTSPININASTRIRAAVFESGAPQGPTASESFIKLDSSVTSFQGTGNPFESNLPLIVFDSFGFQDFDGDGVADVDDNNVRNSNPNFKDDFAPVAGIFIDTTDGTASITDAAEFAGRAGLHVRGRTSQFYDKRPYTLEVWGEGHSDTGLLKGDQTDDLDASFFGLPAESDWVLNGPFADKSHLNNYLTFQWSNEMGLYAPRTKLVEVFVNPDGGSVNYGSDYRGTYVLTEKIKVGNNRVDVARISPTDSSEPEITGGYIWKKDKIESSQGDIISFVTDSGQRLRLVDPNDDEISAAQLSWLENHVEEFEDVLFGPNFADPDQGYTKYIDVKSWIDTWLLVEFTKNVDGFRNSTYYHKDRGGKITQGPAWDYNLSLSNANFLNGAYPDGWYHDQLSDNSYPYWDRLFEDPNFVQKVVDRWQELRDTVLNTTKVIADIDATVAVLSNGNPSPQVNDHTNPISRNFTRWGNVDSFEQFNPWFGVGDYPTNSPVGTGSPTEYNDYVDIVKWFVQNRTDWIDGRYVEAPAISVAGSQVTLTAPDGDIYYTLEGNDPRAGVNVSNPQDTLLAAGSQLTAFVPGDDSLGSSWTETNFDDNSWLSGPGGVGYDDNTNYDPHIGLDVTSEMDGVNSTIYIRAPFTVSGSTASYNTMTLQIQYDDGFVAYLNGTQVATGGFLPASLSWTSSTVFEHPDSQAVQFLNFDISDHLGLIQTGENVLAIHGLNNGVGSSDFLISPRIVAGQNGGAFAPNAILYTGPFDVTGNAVIAARAYDTTHSIPETTVFSGLRSKAVVLETPNIVVSEINYNPHDANPVAGLGELALDNDQFEFLEIINPSASLTANLIGVQITGGVDFNFTGRAVTQIAPANRVLVVKNQAAFESRYGTGLPIAGEFANDTGLSNTSDLIRLQDGVGNVIQEFTYFDGGDWPNRPNGNGSSLVVANTSGDYNNPANWQKSNAFGGTPGVAPLPAGPDVLVNEVSTNTAFPTIDQIELTNVSGATVDISNWWMSDSNNNYFKYQIAGSTTLASGAYLTFDENQFNTGIDAFALSSTGDDVWLIEVDGSGQPIRFADRVEFDAALSGVSLGRIPNGSGKLFPLASPSFNGANGAHQPGDIVITEVHYHPAAPPIGSTITRNQLEFVELTNRSGATIDLTNWRLRGGVDFDLPSSTMQADGTSLVLVAFDPDNATLDAEFRAEHGVPAGVTLLGPWTGLLDNGGETVKLLAPTAGEPVPAHYLVDRVIYDDDSPWPTSPDGSGVSLSRKSTENYGDLAASWIAAVPSPGNPASPAASGDFDGDSDVDWDDYLVWQSTFSSTTDLRADGNGNGIVDAADFTIWRDNLGATLPQLATRSVRAAAGNEYAIPRAPAPTTSVISPTAKASRSALPVFVPRFATNNSGTVLAEDFAKSSATSVDSTTTRILASETPMKDPVVYRPATSTHGEAHLDAVFAQSRPEDVETGEFSLPLTRGTVGSDGRVTRTASSSSEPDLHDHRTWEEVTGQFFARADKGL